MEFRKTIIMKKILPLLVILAIFSTKTDAQIQKGNVLIGADLANLNLILGGGGAFQAQVNPKVAFFIKDNIAVGAMVNFDIATAKGQGTTVDWGVGPLARYYMNDPKVDVLKHGRIFFEGNAGIQGVSLSGGSNTTGLGFGVGPGYTYFITNNIGLETLLKYNGTVGFGSEAYRSQLGLNFGFQIYLNGKRALAIAGGDREK